MIAFFFALLFCLGAGEGNFSEDEDSSEDCSHLLPNKDKLEKMEQVNFVPDEELLKAICPNFVSYMECKEPYITEYKDYFLELKHLIQDLCEEDSRIQKGYLSSANCFRNGFEKWVSCIHIADDIYVDYRRFITRDDNEEMEAITANEPHCITDSYALACVSIRMLDECGAEAHETLMEMSRRSNIVKSFCLPEESLKLKSDFLEFLTHEEHSNLDIFQSYFERKKK